MKNRHIEKIKKLLNLGKSSNLHEAALAMEHAQRLMEEHQVSLVDISLADVNMTEKPVSKAKTPPNYLLRLINLICRSFGCQPVINQRQVGWDRWETSVSFIGIDSAAELAGYAFDVLRRQIERDRKNYLAKLKRCKRQTKITRADAYCQAWVVSVGNKVRMLVPNKEQEGLIKLWSENHFKGLSVLEKRRATKIKAKNADDFMAGFVDGNDAQLHAGMTGTDRRRIEG